MKLYSLKKGLKTARKKKNMTQNDLAENLGVHIKTVMNWEQELAEPSLKQLIEIADLLDCDLDYLVGTLENSTHDIDYISKQTGLSEKAVKMLQVINKESNNMLPYESYAFGINNKDKIIGAGKTLRVINELLENEYGRFVENKKTGIMDNLFTAIDEYMHPLDFEFGVYDKDNNKIISGKYAPVVKDKEADTTTFIPEKSIYRNIIMDRIQRMLMDSRYDLDEDKKKNK